MDIRKIMETAKLTGVTQVAATKEFIPHVYNTFAKHLGLKDQGERRFIDPRSINKALGKKGFALVENENGSRMTLIYKDDGDDKERY